MNFFSIKTSDHITYDKLQNKEDVFTVEGLNSYEDELEENMLVFLSLGGDGTPWTNGLMAIAKTLSGPTEKGYDREKPRNYKLPIQIIANFPATLTKLDFVPYPKSYNSYIGPSTKGERNQSLYKIKEEKAVAIIRGVLDTYPEFEKSIENIVGLEIMVKVKSEMELFTKCNFKYGQSPKNITNKEIGQNNANGLTGENILLYGVPGSGKSYTIKTQYCDDDSRLERVVFHPDYTYSDLVGQILPKLNGGQLEYSFVPGPFTRIMKKALNSEMKEMYYFVIEEINRGNAPAIFGEIFQLLDRDATTYESEYGVTNYDIAKEIYKGDTERKVKIPANLTIIATMNTSDQNVFTLDTAFKRRWSMKMIRNDFSSVSFKDKHLFETGITWEKFVTKINEIIISSDTGMVTNEDKRLGAYFIKESDLDSPTIFAEKVLLYLWNDVFKYNREEIFEEENKTLEMLIQNFQANKFDVFKFSFSE